MFKFSFKREGQTGVAKVNSNINEANINNKN